MNKLKLLLCDDDELCYYTMQRIVQRKFLLSYCANVEKLWLCLEQEVPDLVLLDLNLRTAEDGFVALQQIRRRWPWLPVVIYSGITSYAAVVKAIRLGALDFIPKGSSPQEIQQQIESILQISMQSEMAPSCTALVGEHPKIKQLHDLIGCATRLDQANLLVLGESGTGKSVVVDTLVKSLQSAKGDVQLIEIDCVALTCQQESEWAKLQQDHASLAAASPDNKTLVILFKEINSLPMNLQGRVLRWMEAWGAYVQQMSPDSRIHYYVVATSHLPLAPLVREGKFRQDLCTTLAMFVLEVPPLRERMDDLSLCIDYLCRISDLPNNLHIQADALRLFRAYDWPGNLRELFNVLRYCTSVAHGQIIGLRHLPAKIHAVVSHQHSTTTALSYAARVQHFERNELLRAYSLYGGNISQMARGLKIDRSSLYNKLKRLNILHTLPTTGT